MRRHAWAVALSAALFFGSAAVSFVAVELYPHLGYDLLDDGFVSPSSIDCLSRIGVLSASLALWAVYFFVAARPRALEAS